MAPLGNIETRMFHERGEVDCPKVKKSCKSDSPLLPPLMPIPPPIELTLEPRVEYAVGSVKYTKKEDENKLSVSKMSSKII